jgi:hypothetical protein
MSRKQHAILAALAEAGLYAPPETPVRARNGSAGPMPLPPAGDPQAGRYAAGALTSEAAEVARTPEGQRNDNLNRAAFRMGQLVARGWLDEQAAFTELVDAGQAAGLAYAEAERTVLSGLGAGKQAPRDDVELYPAYGPAQTVSVPLTGGDVPEVSHGMGDPEVAAPANSEPTPEASTPDDPFSAALARAITGAPWVLDTPAQVPALWGDGDDVLWAEGEPLIVTGPTGVGKTTLGTQLVAGRMGLIPSVLGYPVRPGRRVLVLAMDRPRQIQRAMARTLRGHPADVLDDRLVVLPGPPPVDVARRPGVLLWLAEQFEADTVVLDSLKDAALKLSDEETGQGLSRAMNMCVVNGIDVLAYHHQTKRTASGQGKPNTLADVYGSSWITAGAGSVILLWGNAGDLVIELSHLKQPAAEVGPLAIGHDHTAGKSFLYDGQTEADKLLDLLSSGPQSAATVASWLWDGDTDRAAIARARRRLDQLVEAGTVVRLDDPTPRDRSLDGRMRGREGSRYALKVGETHRSTPKTQSILELDVSPGHTEDTRATPVDLDRRRHTTEAHRSTQTTNPQVTPKTHRSTPISGPTEARPQPPFRGGVGGVRTSAPELAPGDVRVCSRCYRTSERFIPAPGGRLWCPECAYPTQPARLDDHDQED